MISPCGEHLKPLELPPTATYTYVWGFAFPKFEMALSSAKCFIPSKRAFSYCLFRDLIKKTQRIQGVRFDRLDVFKVVHPTLKRCQYGKLFNL